MPKRGLFIGGACLLAAAVFLLSLLAGSPESTETPDDADARRDVRAEVPIYDPTERIDEDELEQLTPITEGGVLHYKQDRGQTIIIEYESNTPQPLGVFEVVKPSARFIFSDTMTMTIQADEATIVAPENDLRRGEFRGDVVISLYETEAGAAINPAGNEQVTLRIYLEKTNFDVELGSIESPGSVHLTGPQVDFHGHGLSISYNELHRRLDKLEVLRARSLRFKPAGPDRRKPSADADTPDEAQPEETVAEATDRDSEPVQFYRARFEDRVSIRGDGGRLKMDGDYLDAIFSLTRERAESSRERSGDTGSARSRSREATTNAPATQPALDQPLFVPDDATDVIIALSGRLIVSPENAPPPDLAGPEDVMIRLAGRPVTIETPDGETIVAAEADYLVSTAQVRATGGAQHPMVVESPQLGTIRGKQIAVSQSRGKGYVIGPGQIDARPSDEAGQALGALQFTWVDRLDLEFYLEEDAPTEVGADRIAALRSAAFRGDVKVHESRFDLQATDELTLELTEPDPAGDVKQSLSRIDAAGDVALVVPDDEQPFDIEAQALSIMLDTDDLGEPYPTRVQAREDVHTNLPGVELSAGMLDVTLAPPGLDPPGEQAAAADQPDSPLSEMGDVAIRKVVAQGDVRVRVDEPAVELAAPRLVADVPSDRLELFGDHDSPARIIRDGDTISGKHILLTQADQTVRIDGAGLLDARINPDNSDDVMTVAWQDAMNYDNLAGAAHFVGDVTAGTVSDNGDNRTRLTADDLKLTFQSDETAPSFAFEDETDGDPLSRQRDIETITAGEVVQFVAEAYSPLRDADADRLLESRLTVNGTLLTFDRATQHIKIDSPGDMLIENYRAEQMQPAEDSGADDLPANLLGDEVNFSGRGITLFQWTGKLTLDAQNNDMIINDEVKMTHRPASGGDVVQLDADRFIVDLHETGGLDTLMAGDQPQPEVRFIRADGNVVVLQGERVIFADHLQYTEKDKTVLLWADEGREVEVRDESRDEDIPPAGMIRWNLETDGLFVGDVRGGIIPIQQD